MSVLPTPGPARRRVLTPYVMIWLAVASFALAYLAILGLKPHMFTSAANNAADIEQKITQARRDMERGLADLDPLRRTVGEVKMDVANLKIAVEEASVRDQAIMEKVAALEIAAPKATERPHATSTTATPPATVPPTPTPNPKKAGAPTTFSPPVGPSADEMRARESQKNAKLINGTRTQNASGNIETGSIERKPSVPPVAKPQAAAKPQPVGVILATGPSIDSLRLNWSILTDRYSDAVRNMHPRYVVKGKANNRTYGLVVGPLASTAEAKSLCKDMESRGMPCEVSAYRGNAL